MPAKSKLEDLVTCPACHGERVIPGDRYTEPVRVCPTCDGAGVVPREES